MATATHESSTLMHGDLKDINETATGSVAEEHLEAQKNSIHTINDVSLHIVSEDSPLPCSYDESQSSLNLEDCRFVSTIGGMKMSPRKTIVSLGLPMSPTRSTSKGERSLNDSEATLPTLCSADDSFHIDNSPRVTKIGGEEEDDDEDSKKAMMLSMVSPPRIGSPSLLLSVSPITPPKKTRASSLQEVALAAAVAELPIMAPMSSSVVSSTNKKNNSSSLLEESKRSIAYPRPNHSLIRRRSSLPSSISRDTSAESAGSSSNNVSNTVHVEEKRSVAYPRASAVRRSRRRSLPELAMRQQSASSSSSGPISSSPNQKKKRRLSEFMMEEKRAIAYPQQHEQRRPKGRQNGLPPSEMRIDQDNTEGDHTGPGKVNEDAVSCNDEASNAPPGRPQTARRSHSEPNSTQRPETARRSSSEPGVVALRGLRRNSWVDFKGKSAEVTVGGGGSLPQQQEASCDRTNDDAIRKSRRRRSSHGLSRSSRLAIGERDPPIPSARRSSSTTKAGLRRNRRSTARRYLGPGAWALDWAAPFLNRDEDVEIEVEGEGGRLRRSNDDDVCSLDESELYANWPSNSSEADAEQQEKKAQEEEDAPMCGAYTCCVCMAILAISALIVLVVKPASLYSLNDGQGTTGVNPLFSREDGLDMLIGNLTYSTWQNIQEDSSSPQAAAYKWLINDPSFSSVPTWRHRQRFALASILYSLQGAERRVDWHPDWLSYTTSECEWKSSHGSPCNHDGEYQRLVLEDLPKLRGGLPAEITLLSGLKDIVITSTSGFVEVDLDLDLEDLLPSELRELSALERIDFSNLKLHNSTLPTYISTLTQLNEIHLGGMNLKGTIPTTLGRMTNLNWLTLSENSLTGTLPPELSSLAAVDTLWIQKNQLSGPLPTEWSSMPELQSLFLHENGLSGTLPPEWQHLDLRDLLLQSNDLSGSIPLQWGYMTKLRRLGLAENDMLFGSIPRDICSRAFLDRVSFTVDCEKIQCCLYETQEHQDYMNATLARGRGGQ